MLRGGQDTVRTTISTALQHFPPAEVIRIPNTGRRGSTPIDGRPRQRFARDGFHCFVSAFHCVVDDEDVKTGTRRSGLLSGGPAQLHPGLY